MPRIQVIHFTTLNRVSVLVEWLLLDHIVCVAVQAIVVVVIPSSLVLGATADRGCLALPLTPISSNPRLWDILSEFKRSVSCRLLLLMVANSALEGGAIPARARSLGLQGLVLSETLRVFLGGLCFPLGALPFLGADVSSEASHAQRLHS